MFIVQIKLVGLDADMAKVYATGLAATVNHTVELLREDHGELVHVETVER